MNCFIQRGKTKLNRIFRLSLNEIVCTFARMKNVHYLFYIQQKYFLLFMISDLKPLYTGNTNSVLIAPCQVKGHRSDYKS